MTANNNFFLIHRSQKFICLAFAKNWDYQYYVFMLAQLLYTWKLSVLDYNIFWDMRLLKSNINLCANDNSCFSPFEDTCVGASHVSLQMQALWKLISSITMAETGWQKQIRNCSFQTLSIVSQVMFLNCEDISAAQWEVYMQSQWWPIRICFTY